MFTLSLLLVSVNANIGNIPGLNLINTSSEQAVQSIKDAELAGADVSMLIQKYNKALDLIQGNVEIGQAACSEDNCIAQANELLKSIVHDSSAMMTNKTSAEDQSSLMIILLYSALAAFCLSIATVVLYKFWKSYTINRFLNMAIAGKREEQREES